MNNLPTAPHKTKGKRGGQKGNHNARKHGFYSTSLDPAQICQFWNLVNLKGVDPEVAAANTKLRSLLRVDPHNRRALLEAAKLLTKWGSAKYRLGKTNTGYLRKIIVAALQLASARAASRSDLDKGINP